MNRRSLLQITICICALLLAGCGAVPDSNPKDKPEKVQAEAEQEDTKDEESKPGKKSEEKKPELDTKQAEKNLKEMSDAMVSYLWVALMTEAEGDVFNPGEGLDLKLSDSDKIRAAVLASETDGIIDSYFSLKQGKLTEDKNAETGPDGEGFHGMSVPDKSVDENCLNLFGEVGDRGALPKEPVCDLFDAVSYTCEDGTYALKINREIETETALKNYECTVAEDNGKYVGEVNMFWGYWGEMEQKPGYSNYLVTYTLEPNDKSKYKMAITAISVKQTKEDRFETDETGGGDAAADSQEPFFGLWVNAYKDRSDAEALVTKLEEKGLPASYVYSCDWENLNKEPYYCVTIGKSGSEPEAQAYIEDAAKAGFPDAYVKYTGERIDN